ncbi:MAG: hypothetical protein ACLQG3_02465 [Terracidiphilus sp.]
MRAGRRQAAKRGIKNVLGANNYRGTMRSSEEIERRKAAAKKALKQAAS